VTGPLPPTAADSPVLDHPGVARVHAALHAAGVTPEIVVLDDHARTAVEAAAQLGVGVEQIASSLVFAVPDGTGTPGPLLVLTSGAHRVDTAAVAARIGAPRLDRVSAQDVRAWTGFAIGGVAPVGHTRPMPTLVDIALEGHDAIWAAAGHPRAVFRTSFTELVRITGGRPVPVV